MTQALHAAVGNVVGRLLSDTTSVFYSCLCYDD